MYTFIRVLHSSATSDIKLYQNASTGRQVVIKTPTNDSRVSSADVVRLIQLNPHPNITSYMPDTSQHQVVMDYYPGGDLFCYIEQFQQDLSHMAIKKMIRQIFLGVSHLHALDIAHLDISLENILLDNELTCRLCDFEAAVLSATTRQGAVGKMFYMAPEVYSNVTKYDGFQADMWSLGILLFIVLNGHPPFEVASIDNQNFQLFKQMGVRPMITRSVEDESVDLLEQLLVVSPNQRMSIHDALYHPFLINNQ